MTTWEKFEEQCTNFLNKEFGAYAKFTRRGGTDSTIPDILTKTNSGNLFYIEAKHSPAQCGQFVLIPDFKNKIFEYSQRNINPINEYSKMIVNYMNVHFEKFSKAGTAGQDINIPNGSDIFSNWIIHTYKKKNVRFFITNNYTIFPIDCLKEHFEVTAKYRIKRSGSTNVGKLYINDVMKYVIHNYKITNHRTENGKLFVISSQDLDKCKFKIFETEYMFSPRGSEYEIRKLSNTNNANVIFSVTQKASIKGMPKALFIDSLK